MHTKPRYFFVRLWFLAKHLNLVVSLRKRSQVDSVPTKTRCLSYIYICRSEFLQHTSRRAVAALLRCELSVSAAVRRSENTHRHGEMSCILPEIDGALLRPAFVAPAHMQIQLLCRHPQIRNLVPYKESRKPKIDTSSELCSNMSFLCPSPRTYNTTAVTT